MDPIDLLERAVNGHDLDALAACFATGYRNETPAHPARSFVGRDQVRTNWSQIFAGLPDITATVLRVAVDDAVVWSEWDMRGTRPDGSAQALAGVIVFGVEDDLLSWGRFYLEPVEPEGGDVEQTIDRLVAPSEPAP